MQKLKSMAEGLGDLSQVLLAMEQRMAERLDAIDAKLDSQEEKLTQIAADKADLAKQLELQSSAMSLQLQMLQRVGKQVTALGDNSA